MKNFLLILVILLTAAVICLGVKLRQTKGDNQASAASVQTKAEQTEQASITVSESVSTDDLAKSSDFATNKTSAAPVPEPASPSPLPPPASVKAVPAESVPTPAPSAQAKKSSDFLSGLISEDVFVIPENLTKDELIARHNNWSNIQKTLTTAFARKKLAADTVIIKRILALKDLSSSDKVKYSSELAKSLLQGIAETGDPVILTQAEAFINDCLNSDNPEIRFSAVNFKSGIFETRLLPLYRSKILANLPEGVTEEQVLTQMRGPAPKKYTPEELNRELLSVGHDIIAFLMAHPEFVSRIDDLTGMMQQIDEKTGQKILIELVDSMRTSGKESLKRAAERFEGPLRMAKLPGSEMKVEGLFLDGKPIDWKSYKGKVVLVDFWATWCGPCLGEIPNMLEQYKKYHDKGFEIVGYSIDEDLQALKKFEADRKLPWKVLSLTMSTEKGMTNLAEYYGINSVPTMILIGRDGKVIRTDARANVLNKELENLFK